MNRFNASTIDVRQHLWPPAYISELRRRRTAPRLSGWTLVLGNGDSYEVDPADHDCDLGHSLMIGNAPSQPHTT